MFYKPFIRNSFPLFQTNHLGGGISSGRAAFSLLEIIIAMIIAVLVLGVLYMIFGSGSKQATVGTAKLETHHRLRMVTEVLKDDLREAERILTQTGVYSDSLEYIKFGGLVDYNGLEVQPRLTKVKYSFDESEKRLLGVYGKDGELVNTQLFESASFLVAYFHGRPFVRMRFEISNEEDKGRVTIYQTVSSRHLSGYIGQRFWFPVSGTQGEVFD